MILKGDFNQKNKFCNRHLLFGSMMKTVGGIDRIFFSDWTIIYESVMLPSAVQYFIERGGLFLKILDC